MSQIDVSLHAATFGNIVRRRAQISPVCETEPALGDLLLERLEVGPPTLERGQGEPRVIHIGGSTVEVPAHRVLLHIPFTAYLASEDDIRQGGLGGAANPTEFPFTATFRVDGSLDTSTGAAGIRITYQGKDVTLPDPQDDLEFDARLETAGGVTALPIADIAQQLGIAVAARNVGVAVDAEATRLVVRVETTTPANAEHKWTSFYATPPDDLNDHGWAFMLDGELVASVLESRIGDALDGEPSVDRTGAPQGSWEGTSCGATVEAEADLLAACPLTGAAIGVDLLADAEFSFQGLDLVVDLSIEFDLHDGDVFVCGMAAGAVLGAAGAALGAILGPVGAVVGTVVGQVLGVSLVVGLASGQGLPSVPGVADCTTTVVGDRQIDVHCEIPVPIIQDEAVGRLTPKGIACSNEGLIIFGTAIIGTGDFSLTVDPEPLHWERKGNCAAKKVEINQIGGLTFHLAPGFQVPLDVCRIEVVDDPLGFFYTSEEYVATGTRKFLVHHRPELWDAYTSTTIRNPCRLFVQTSGGARFVDLGGLPDKPALGFGQTHKAIVRNCLVAYDKFWGGRFNPLWLPDPGPEGAMHLWQIGVNGLQPGDQAQVLAGEQVVMSAEAGESGRVVIETVLPPGFNPTIARKAASPGARPPHYCADTHGLAIRQTVLVRAGQAALGQPVEDFTILRGRAGTRIATRGAGGVSVWRLAGGSRPQMAWQAPMACRSLQVDRGLLGIDDGERLTWLDVADAGAPRIARIAACDEPHEESERSREIDSRDSTKSADCGVHQTDRWLQRSTRVGRSLLVRLEQNGTRLVTYRRGRALIL